MQRAGRRIGSHQVQRLTHRHTDGSSDVFGDDANCKEGHSAQRQRDNDEGCPARHLDIANQFLDENHESHYDTGKCSEHAYKGHKSERSGAQADYETPEMGEKLTVGVARGMVGARSKENRTICNAPKRPAECHIKEYAWSHIGGHATSNFAEHEAKAAEPNKAPIGEHSCGDYLGRPRAEVSKKTVRRGVRRDPVDERCMILKRDIKHPPKVLGIELAILVHRDYPFGASRGHAGDRGGMLSKVPGQPYGSDERQGRSQASYDGVGMIRSTVVNEQDFVNAHRVTRWRRECLCQGTELFDECIQGVLTAIYRHDD